jgi:CDP-4-dehydro-6-deoxyglucose reductase
MSSTPNTGVPQPKALHPTRIQRKMTVSKICDYTPQIRELFITCTDPKNFEFRAGQFVMLHVPPDLSQGPIGQYGKPLKPALRAYSIASTDERNDGFRLVFKYVDNGIASKFVWGLTEGEVLDFTGPFGRVFFKEPPTEQVIFMNTGSGISQHFSFIESNLKKYPDLRYRLLFGVRFKDDIYYRAELERLKSQLKDFDYRYVLSRPDDSWTGAKGYVQNHIDDFDYKSLPTTFYLCGNGAMIKDVKAKLEADGFDMRNVLAEAFD